MASFILFNFPPVLLKNQKLDTVGDAASAERGSALREYREDCQTRLVHMLRIISITRLGLKRTFLPGQMGMDTVGFSLFSIAWSMVCLLRYSVNISPSGAKGIPVPYSLVSWASDTHYT